MNIFLVASAALLFIFGALLTLFPSVLKKVSNFLNKAVLSLEDMMEAKHTLGGTVLLALSIVVMYVAVKK